MSKASTRGFGVLEKWLANKRYALADTLISGLKTRDRILDIGCGNPPLFLESLDFKEKYGLDGNSVSETIPGGRGTLFLNSFDILNHNRFPYNDNFFDCITMLAFIEHIPAGHMATLGTDIYRILKKDGFLIITTPTLRAHALLRIMARFHLVSALEIADHRAEYSAKTLYTWLSNAGFKKPNIKQGSFELFCNLWIRAQK